MQKSCYKLKDRGVTSYTVENWKCVIRGFFKGTSIEKAQCLKRGKFKYPKKTSKDLLTEEQVKRIIETVTDTQHRAIIAVLWETGCRPGELCNCNISDFVEIGNKCRIVLDGKTGIRERALIISAKYMKRWIEAHPFRNQLDKPLFISKSHPRFHQRITDWTLSDIVKNASKNAGITKNITPYIFRHSRATNLAQFLTEMELRHYFGWTKDSTMPGTYIHLSGKDIDNKYENIITGKKTKLEPESSVLLPEDCPNCNELVESTALYCYKCGYNMKGKYEAVERDLSILEMFRTDFAKFEGVDIDKMVKQYRRFKAEISDIQKVLDCFNGGNVVTNDVIKKALRLDDDDCIKLLEYLCTAELIELDGDMVVLLDGEKYQNFITMQKRYLEINAV